MTANKTNVIALFSQSNFQFVIPVYQRNYDWDKSIYDKFFDDLMQLIPDDIYNHGLQDKYFLGTIILKETDDEDINANWIIDGQQRLTTIYLLLCAIKSTFKDSNEIVYLCNELLFNSNLNKLDNQSKLKLKLVKTDNAVLQDIIANNDSSYSEKHKSSSKVKEVKDAYCKYLKNPDYHFFANSQLVDNGIKRMQYFLTEVLKNVQLVQVTLSKGRISEQNEQEIFDRINATGKQLDFSELLCNFLLMGETTYKQKTELYQTKWKKLEAMCNNDKKELAEFLNYFFKTKIAVDLPSSHDAKNHEHNISYSSFKNWYKKIVEKIYPNQSEQAKLFVFNELLKFCNYYLIMTAKNLNTTLIDNQTKCILLWLKMLQTKVHYPLLLELVAQLDQNNISPTSFRQIVFYLFNYLVRSSLLPDQKGLNSLFLSTLTAVFGISQNSDDDSKAITNENCLQKITEQFTEIGKYEFLSDAKFKDLLWQNKVSDAVALTILLMCHYTIYPQSLNVINKEGIKLIQIFSVNKNSQISYKMEDTLANKAITKEDLKNKEDEAKINVLLNGEFKDLYKTLPTFAINPDEKYDYKLSII